MGKRFPYENVKITYTPYHDDYAAIIERTTGADPDLPPVIFCHGSGANFLQLTMGNYAMGVIQHSIASGYKWLAALNGDPDTEGEFAGQPAGHFGWSNDAAMYDMNGLYEMTGADKVIVTGWSMGGAPSLRWVAENPEKVAGWIGTAPACSAEGYWFNSNAYGHKIDLASGTETQQTVLTFAFGDLSTPELRTAAFTTRDPMNPNNLTDPDGVLLASLKAQKDKIVFFLTEVDSIANPVAQYDAANRIGAHVKSLENCNHNFYIQSDFDDDMMTKQFHIFAGKMQPTPTPPSPVVAAITKTDDLVHYYKGDDMNSPLTDCVGTEDLTVGGTGVGYRQTSLTKDGVGSFSTIPASNGIATKSGHTGIAGSGSFTYLGWIELTTSSANLYLFGEASSAENNSIVHITISDGLLRGFARNSSLTNVSVTATTSVNDGNRHFVAFTGDRSTNTVKLYVDDPSAGPQATDTNYPTGTYNLDHFAIGGLYRATTSNYCPAKYNHIAVYDRALSQAELSAIYEAAL